MTESKDNVFPTTEYSAYKEPGETDPITGGLTKREHFAALAMQGLLANPTIANGISDEPGGWEILNGDIGLTAVNFADELIKSLNQND